MVIVRDRTTFEARYGTDVNVAGQYSGRLDNAGESIRLEDAIGQTILDFSYKDGWRFKPRKDITAYELALITKAVSNVNSLMSPDWIREQPHGVRRHYTPLRYKL